MTFSNKFFYYNRRTLQQYLYDPAISFNWIDYIVDSIYIFFHNLIQNISETYQNQKRKITEFLNRKSLKLFFDNNSLSNLQPHSNQVYRYKKGRKRISSMANDDYGSLSSLELTAKIEDEIKNSQINHIQESYSIMMFEIPKEQDLEYHIAQLPNSCFPLYDLDQISPPKKTKILALDLDETLVHSCFEGAKQWDFMVEVLIGRSSCLYYVFKRPYLDYFLSIISKWYHLVIFTASLKEYADPVVTWLDNGKKIFKKRLFRNVNILLLFNISFLGLSRERWLVYKRFKID